MSGNVSLKKNKMCLVAPYLGANGKALYWAPIFAGLAERGLDVEVVTGAIFDPEECPSIVQNYTVSFKRIFNITIPSPYSVMSVMRVKCDVMFILEFSILALLSTIIVALKGGTKSIVLVENSPKFTSTNRTGVFGMLRKFQCKICDKILTNNQGGFDYLVNELGVDPSKIIQSIYLTSSIAPAGLPSRDVAGAEKVKFVCIGRLIDGKGFLALIHEVATLDEAERARVEIDVFGNGPLRDMLQSEIDKNALSDVIRLRGNIPYAELGSRIAGADAFIMPTLEDYRSLASFEALSLGLPLLI